MYFFCDLFIYIKNKTEIERITWENGIVQTGYIQ